MTTQTFTSSGSITFPAGVTSVIVSATAEGGSGAISAHGSHSGAGGGGGEFSQDTVRVTPGIPYSFTIGTGGTGVNTVFTGDNITVTANFGGSTTTTTGGTGGTGSTNAIHFDGGAGGAGGGTNNTGGGGGGSAGSGSAGGIGASSASGGAGGSAGTGTIPGAVGASAPGALNPGADGNAPGSGASGGGSGGSINHAGGTGAPGQIVFTYQAVFPGSPLAAKPAITPLDINGAKFQRRSPASYPGVYIQGITATDTVTANVGTPVVNRTGLASAVTDRSFFGNVVIQPNYQYPAPFPVSLPYPMNLTLGPYRVQARYNTNVAVPTIVVFGITAQAAVSAPSDFGFQSVTPGIFFNQFSFANNIPYPLNIINRVRPQIQGQPLAYVAEPTINVSAVAPFGSVNISKVITANENVAASFGGIFIQGKVQPSYPFTNFPLPLKLRNLRPQYSSGKIKFPTVVFGLTANVSVSAPSGIVEIGKAVPGFVSNNFAASVPGLCVVSVPKNASNVSVHPSSPGAKITAFGTLASSTSSAYFGSVSIKELGIRNKVDVNAEFGTVHAGDTDTGTTATVTASAYFGNLTVSLNKTANVSSASSVHLSITKTGLVSSVVTASRFGIIKISQSNSVNITAASTVRIKISPSVAPAQVTSKSFVKTTISVPVTASHITANSVAGTRTSVGQTSSVSIAAPKGITAVKIVNNPSGVTAKANNEGKVIQGITATVTSTAYIGGISTGYSLSSVVAVAAHLGAAGTSSIHANVIHTWSARLDNGD